MVTKPQTSTLLFHIRSVLAKIFMVTKLIDLTPNVWNGSVLAKIFMVTKHNPLC